MQKLLENPHEMFYSSTEKAEAEHKKVAERLEQIGEISHAREFVEFQTHPEQGSGGSVIDIAWQVPASRYGSLLRLDPIKKRKDSEGGSIAYRGAYGLAAQFK